MKNIRAKKFYVVFKLIDLVMDRQSDCYKGLYSFM